MEGRNLGIVTIFTTTIVVFGSDSRTIPTWSDTYYVKGILHIPYAEVDEPIEAWFDGPSKLSRISYYDGMVKTYHLGNVGNGTSFKIVPVTTEEVENQMVCFKVDGNDTIEPQSVLPSLDGFEYKGEEQINEISTEKWEMTEVIGKKVNRYKMFITYKALPNNTEKVAVPMKFEMRGYNNLFKSHYDHYYLEYTSFNTDDIPESTFKLDPKITCHYFNESVDDYLYTFNPIAEFIIPVISTHIDSQFGGFKSKHNVTYQNETEHMQRKDIFRQNMRFIHSTNRRNLGYSLAVNHLVDKHEHELRAMRGAKYSREYNGGKPFPFKISNKIDIPTQYDWRLFGAVSPVTDQGVCGSCWSFSAIGVIESAYFLHNGGNLVKLSEQALIDCSWGYYNSGCDGGFDYMAYRWILKHGGVPTEEDYGPYLSEDGYCHAETVQKVAKIKDWINVTANNETVLRFAIFKHGPISVTINSDPRTFIFYSNGIYYDPSCSEKPDDSNHIVMVIGYGSIKGEKYWLIKNSWSIYWGNGGYMLMSSRRNTCGIMNSPIYVTM